MFDINHFFRNLFGSKEVSDSELGNYGTVSVQCMEANNPGGVLTPRINATKAALNAFKAGTSTDSAKLGTQKGKTTTKKEFRLELPAEIAKIHGAVIAAYGPGAPEVSECFPEGRRVFGTCRDDDLQAKLQALITGLTPKVPPLAPGVLESASALLDDWVDTFEAQGAAKGAKKGTANSAQSLRAALELELWKNVLTIALLYICDESKVPLYFPQELLRNRAVPETPGPATLSAGPFNEQTGEVTFTMLSQFAQTFTLKRNIMGEADRTPIATDIPAVNGVATFTDKMSFPGTYEYQAVPFNGTREGPPSGVVTVEEA